MVGLRPWTLLAVSLAAPACVSAAPIHDEAARLIQNAHARGVELQDPMALDPGVLAEVRDAVGGRGEPVLVLKHLDEYLKNGGSHPFEYTPAAHLDARRAYAERRGDCMSYALLFAALSRSLGIPTYFVHATEIVTRYERAGWFFVSSHVAVGYGHGPQAVVIDFSEGRITDWNLTTYDVIDDGTALALHYNNVAVELMLRGRTETARGLLAAMLAERPRVPELYSNLGVILNREHRYQEALGVLQNGIGRFSSYPPLYTNAILAAQGAGRPELVAQLEVKGRQIADKDPFFLFARGLRLYQNQAYGEAASELRRASDAHPESPVILAWLTRAYLSAGDREHARQVFEQTRRLAPDARLVRELSHQFPELAR